MALKLRLIKELGVVIAAYILARVRLALTRIAPVSQVDHRWVSFAALVVGVLTGVAAAQWTKSEYPRTGELTEISTAVIIGRDQDAYEFAVVGPYDSAFVDSSVTPETFDIRGGHQGSAATNPDGQSEKSQSVGIQESGLSPSTQSVPATTHLHAGPPAWQRFAVATGFPAMGPMVAVVIDDLGVHVRNAARTIALPGPLTLSFMSYAQDLQAQTEMGTGGRP